MVEENKAVTCPDCGKEINLNTSKCSVCGCDCKRQTVTGSSKNRILAGVLAIVLGNLGIHKFYLGKIGQGILYVLFCWTGIPGLIGIIEGILYLCMTDQEFSAKYG